MRPALPFRPRKLIPIGVGVALLTTAAAVIIDGPGNLSHSAPAYGSVADVQQVTPAAVAAPQQVTVKWDGQQRTTVTTDATVGQLLGNLGIALHAADTVRPAAATTLSGVSSVVVTRIRHVTRVTRVRLPYKVVKRKAPALTVGHHRVLRAGKAGVKKVTYNVTLVNGKVTKKTKVRTTIAVKPRSRIIEYGTLPSGVGASPAKAKVIAKELLKLRGIGGQFSCLSQMWTRESGWNLHAENPIGAYGIPQALPGSKMAAAGGNWRNNARTQIAWGLNYIASRYGTPCAAWAKWQIQGWY